MCVLYSSVGPHTSRSAAHFLQHCDSLLASSLFPALCLPPLNIPSSSPRNYHPSFSPWLSQLLSPLPASPPLLKQPEVCRFCRTVRRTLTPDRKQLVVLRKTQHRKGGRMIWNSDSFLVHKDVTEVATQSLSSPWQGKKLLLTG